MKTAATTSMMSIDSLFNAVKGLVSSSLTTKCKKCGWNLRARFRIFNLSLKLLQVLRLHKAGLANVIESAEAVLFQYKAYQFAWQYFGGKQKFCTRTYGDFLREDVDVLKETLQVVMRCHERIASSCRRKHVYAV